MKTIIGMIVGLILGWIMSAVAQKPEFQRPAPAVEVATLPGGMKPDGRVAYLKLDKDGYVLATCRNSQ